MTTDTTAAPTTTTATDTAAPAAAATDTASTTPPAAAEGAADTKTTTDSTTEKPAADGKTDAAGAGDDKKSDDATAQDGDKSSDEGSKDDKSDPDKSPDGKEPKDGDAKEEPTAQDYRDNFQLPEGLEVNEPRFEKAVEILQKHKVPPEAMKELGPLMGDILSDAARQQQQQFHNMTEGWYDQTVAEHGKEGEEAFNKKTAIAQTALNALFTPETKNLVFKHFGLGTHPEIFKVFYQLGQQMSEDGSFSSPAVGGQDGQSVEAIWYPNATE